MLWLALPSASTDAACSIFLSFMAANLTSFWETDHAILHTPTALWLWWWHANPFPSLLSHFLYNLYTFAFCFVLFITLSEHCVNCKKIDFVDNILAACENVCIVSWVLSKCDLVQSPSHLKYVVLCYIINCRIILQGSWWETLVVLLWK